MHVNILCLQPVIHEVRSSHMSVKGVAKVVGRTRIPGCSIVAVKVSGIEKPSRHLVAEPAKYPLPPGLVVIPTLVGTDNTSGYVRVANLSEDVWFRSGTSIAVLHAVEAIESGSAFQLEVS